MAVPDERLDAQLGLLEGTSLILCSAEPTSYATALSLALATQAITGGDYTLGAGTPDGRQDTLAPTQGTTVDTSGTATHAATVTLTGTIFNLSTSLVAPVALTAAGTVNIGNYVHTARDAT